MQKYYMQYWHPVQYLACFLIDNNNICTKLLKVTKSESTDFKAWVTGVLNAKCWVWFSMIAEYDGLLLIEPSIGFLKMWCFFH